jgi:hypothetical protein
MSVILKSSSEIAAVTGALLHHYNLFRDLVLGSPVYMDLCERNGGETEEIQNLFICWLMFRVWVANKVAYAVQYGDPVNLREDLPDIVPAYLALAELASELSSINYNIYTNGGQLWLDHQWHALFMEILDRLKVLAEVGEGRAS